MSDEDHGGFLHWFAKSTGLFDQTLIDHKDRELAKQEERERGLTYSNETYVGTHTPVMGDNGQQKRRVTDGTVEHEDNLWSWLDLMPGVSLAKTRAKETESSLGHLDQTSTKGYDLKVADVPAVAKDAAAKLSETREEPAEDLAAATRAREHIAADIRSRMAGQPSAAVDAALAKDTRYQKLVVVERDLQAKVAKIDAGLKALANPKASAEQVEAVVNEHKLLVEPRYKVVAGESDNRTRKLEWAFWTGAAGASSEHVHSETRDGTTKTQSAKKELEVAEGKYSQTHKNESSTVSADGTTTTGASSASKEVTVGGGALTVADSSGDSRSTKRAGKVVDGHDQQRKSSTSIMVSEDSTGVGHNGELTSSKTTNGVTRSTTLTGGAQLTDKGVAAQGSAGKNIENEAFKGGVKTSANGAFTVEVKPVKPDQQYQVVITVNAGLGASGDVQKKPKEGDGDVVKNSAGANLGATASAKLVYTHLLSKEQAAHYLSQADRLDAGEKEGEGGLPEFGVLSKLNLLNQEARDGNAHGVAAVLGGSQAAAGLGDGESVELTLAGGLDGGLKAGRAQGKNSASASISAGASLSRTLKVSGVHDAKGRHLVDVSVAFADTHKWGASAAGTVSGVSANLNHAESAGNGNTVVFRLRADAPDYDSCFHDIVGALTPGALAKLKDSPKLKSHLWRHVASKSEDSSTSGGAGAAGLGLDISAAKHKSQEITLGHDDNGTATVEGTFSGSQTRGVGVKFGNVTGLSSSETNGATGTASKDGVHIDLETSTKQTNPVRSVKEGASGLWDYFTSFGEGGVKKKAAEALEKPPKERIVEQLQKTYESLHGYSLGKSDVEALVRRAGEVDAAKAVARAAHDQDTQHRFHDLGSAEFVHGINDRWKNCASSLDVIAAWDALRAHILHPQPDKEWLAVDEKVAREMALVRAVVDFVAATGKSGRMTLEHALRHWNEDSSSVVRDHHTADLGAEYEWPNQLLPTKKSFDAALAKVDSLGTTLATLAQQDGGSEKERAHLKSLEEDLGKIYVKVDQFHGFEHPRAKMEMLDRLHHASETVAAASANANGQGASTAANPQLRIQHLEAQLRTFKAEEMSLFAQARGMLDKANGGEVEGFFGHLVHEDNTKAMKLMSETGELHTSWMARIQELRQLYQQAKVEPSHWVVSAGPGQARRAAEPDVATQTQIYRGARSGSNEFVDDREANIKNWVKRGAEY